MLAGTAGLLDWLADPTQRTAAHQWIDQLTAQVPVASAVGQAVAEVQAEVQAEVWAAMRGRRAAAAVAAGTGGIHGGEERVRSVACERQPNMIGGQSRLSPEAGG